MASAGKAIKSGKAKKPGKAKARKPRKAAAPRHRHSVYVIELSPEVLQEAKFRRANPDYDVTKPCVYVGMTGLTPEQRFANHRKGVKSNRYAHQYGLRLLPRLYAVFNPMPYRAAQDMEIELAIGLREEGYGVWQA
jgi:hypothetical protein